MFTLCEHSYFMNNKETEIVKLALENLYKYTQILGELQNNALENDHTINLHLGHKKAILNIGVKTVIQNYQLQQIINLGITQKPFLWVAEHIFPKIKDELRKNEIGYLETNGNIFINIPGIYIFIDNKKPLSHEKIKANRTFGKTGLKVVFHFLLNNNFINNSYRLIAKQTGVALGNINYVITGLKESGFLISVNKNEYQLIHKKQLLEKWMVAFNENLKPSLFIGKFRFLHKEDEINWKMLPIKIGKTYWGAEPAADLLTNYLKPQMFILYTDESRSELIKNYKLVPDDNGTIEVYKKFWQHNEINSNIAPTQLVYADLINSGDGRNIETAQKIFNEFLSNKF